MDINRESHFLKPNITTTTLNLINPSETYEDRVKRTVQALAGHLAKDVFKEYAKFKILITAKGSQLIIQVQGKINGQQYWKNPNGIDVEFGIEITRGLLKNIIGDVATSLQPNHGLEFTRKLDGWLNLKRIQPNPDEVEVTE